jgi:hypothetical protein
MRVKSRLKIAIGTAALAVIALIAGLIVPAMAASATTSARPIFIEWKPGTPLPAVANGWKVMAEPPSKVLAKLKPGEKIPMVVSL